MGMATRTVWPKDDRLWRVQAIGEAHPSPGVPSELSLDVLLDWVHEPGVGAPVRARTTVKASIPQLPSLHIGQLSRNGLRVGLVPTEEFDGKLDFSPDNCNLIDAGEPLPRDPGAPTRYLIPLEVHPFGPLLRSRCLAIGYKGKPNVIIIPCPEIARAWYFRSTDLALRLTEGPLSHAMHRLWNPVGTSELVTGEWQAKLRTGLDHYDAYVVSLIRFDLYARQQVRRLVNSLVRPAVKNQPRFMEARPPLVGKWPMRAQGKWFWSGGVKRFLVYYLTDIPYPPSPDLIHWNLDNSNFTVDTGEPKKPGKGWPQQQDKKEATKNHQLGNDAEPNKNISAVHEAAVMPRFIDPPRLKRAAASEQKTESAPNRAPPPPSDGSVSTGEGGNHPGSGTRLRIHESGRPNTDKKRQIPPADFDELCKVMAHLNTNSALRCRIKRGSRKTAGSVEEPRSLFRIAEHGVKEPNPWVLVDGRARQYMVVEMTLDKTHHAYAVEVERRKDSKTGKDKEQYTLAVVAKKDASDVSQAEFAILAGLCAKHRGVWRNNDANLGLVKLKHGYEGTENFARGVEDAVIQLVPATKAAILARRPAKAKKPKQAKKRSQAK